MRRSTSASSATTSGSASRTRSCSMAPSARRRCGGASSCGSSCPATSWGRPSCAPPGGAAGRARGDPPPGRWPFRVAPGRWACRRRGQKGPRPGIVRTRQPGEEDHVLGVLVPARPAVILGKFISLSLGLVICEKEARTTNYVAEVSNEEAEGT